jgi:tetratricopeptide (TPR) repeat protein
MHRMNRARTTALACLAHAWAIATDLFKGSLSLLMLLLAGAVLAFQPGHAQSPREASVAPAHASHAGARPTDLRDVNAWVSWKNAQQLDVLPAEARLFYRRGLIARLSGQDQEAYTDLRGALELDPSFLEPHVKLASWSLFSDPAQMLQHCAAVLDLWRHDFNVQLDLVANALVLGLEALFAGLLFAGLFIVVHHRHELAHGLHEELGRIISPLTARWWVPVILVLPFLAGAGLALPVLGLLAFLWPMLRSRERVLTALLAVAAIGAPLALSTLGRFTLALHTETRPFYELPLLENATWDASRMARLQHNAEQDPHDGFAQFALAWYARRGGQLEVADRAYRAALAAWPGNDAVLTDLGNVTAMRGHADEALELYARAAKNNARNAAAHFNASQLHTRRFEYTASNSELRQASALDFDQVRLYQSRAGSAGMLPLMDVWPAPQTFWSTLSSAAPPRGVQPLPLMLRGHMETAGWPFSFAALVALALGRAWGRWQHRRLPLRACSNCGVVVCRRCAKRRREAAQCAECDRISAGAETPEFSRVLLLQHRARRRDGARIGRTALAALVPGYGLLAHHRVFGPTLLIACAWLLARLAFGFEPPFSMTPRLSQPGGDVPVALLMVGLLAVYTWSLVGYFVVVARERGRESQLAAATRGRLTQSTRHQSNLAA